MVKNWEKLDTYDTWTLQWVIVFSLIGTKAIDIANLLDFWQVFWSSKSWKTVSKALARFKSTFFLWTFMSNIHKIVKKTVAKSILCTLFTNASYCYWQHRKWEEYLLENQMEMISLDPKIMKFSCHEVIIFHLDRLAVEPLNELVKNDPKTNNIHLGWLTKHS